MDPNLASVSVSPRALTLPADANANGSPDPSAYTAQPQVLITNDSPQAMAYRVKCNHSHLFAVLPEAKGVVRAHCTLTLTVGRRIPATPTPPPRPTRAPPAPLAKLLIELTPLPSSMALGRSAVRQFWQALAQAPPASRPDDRVAAFLVEVYAEADPNPSPSLNHSLHPSSNSNLGPAAVSDVVALEAISVLARAAPASPLIHRTAPNPHHNPNPNPRHNPLLGATSGIFSVASAWVTVDPNPNPNPNPHPNPSRMDFCDRTSPARDPNPCPNPPSPLRRVHFSGEAVHATPTPTPNPTPNPTINPTPTHAAVVSATEGGGAGTGLGSVSDAKAGEGEGEGGGGLDSLKSSAGVGGGGGGGVGLESLGVTGRVMDLLVKVRVGEWAVARGQEIRVRVCLFPVARKPSSLHAHLHLTCPPNLSS